MSLNPNSINQYSGNIRCNEGTLYSVRRDYSVYIVFLSEKGFSEGQILSFKRHIACSEANRIKTERQPLETKNTNDRKSETSILIWAQLFKASLT